LLTQTMGLKRQKKTSDRSRQDGATPRAPSEGLCAEGTGKKKQLKIMKNRRGKSGLKEIWGGEKCCPRKYVEESRSIGEKAGKQTPSKNPTRRRFTWKRKKRGDARRGTRRAVYQLGWEKEGEDKEEKGDEARGARPQKKKKLNKGWVVGGGGSARRWNGEVRDRGTSRGLSPTKTKITMGKGKKVLRPRTAKRR